MVKIENVACAEGKYRNFTGVILWGDTEGIVKGSHFTLGHDNNKNAIVNFHGGVWLDGVWNYGIWESGIWRKGVWRNGEWKRGVWKDGIWKDGIWRDGTWKDGTWKNGVWHHGNGIPKVY